MLHAGSSTASHRRANAVWVDTLPGSSVVVIFELAQNSPQLLFAAHPAIWQAITVIPLSRKIENCLWAPNTYSCSIIHMCCAIFCCKTAKMDSLAEQERTSFEMHERQNALLDSRLVLLTLPSQCILARHGLPDRLQWRLTPRYLLPCKLHMH